MQQTRRTIVLPTAKRRSDRPKGPTREQLATLLATLYSGIMLTKVHLGATGSQPFSTLTRSVQECFLRAADTCAGLQADPLVYVTAQFAGFTYASKFRKRKILPMPQHLSGMGAMARYVEHAVAHQEIKHKQTAPMPQIKEFYREERKLKGLCNMLRLPPSEVLTSRSSEFTPEFLAHHGVWEIVEFAYNEQMGL